MGCLKQREATAPSKTVTLVPEFAVEDMPLRITAALVPEFAVKDHHLEQSTMMMMIMMMHMSFCFSNMLPKPPVQDKDMSSQGVLNNIDRHVISQVFNRKKFVVLSTHWLKERGME